MGDLERSAQRSSDLLALSVGHIICSAALRVEAISEEAAQLLGGSPPELVGQLLPDICLPLATSGDELRAICAGRRAQLLIEQINIEGYDRPRYISLMALPYSGGLIVTLSDVTITSQQQQRLQQQHHELALLHEKIARQNGQLRQLNTELAERSQRASDMLAIATHDLRAPLATLAEYSDTLLRGRHSAEQAELLAAIGRQARQMQHTLGMLLDLQGIEAHDQQRRHPVSLSLLAIQVARSFQGQAARAGVRLVSSASAERLIALGNWDALQQALANLLSRAITQAGAGGHVMLTIERLAELPALDPPLSAGAAWGALHVHDSGPELSEPERAALERLLRGDPHRPAAPEHSPGMVIVRLATQQHGGRALVSSRAGRGTTISLLLPCSQSALDGEPAGG